MLLLLHYPPSPMTIASASTIEIAHIIPPFSSSFTPSHPLTPPHTYLHLLTPTFCSIGLGMNLLLRADYVFLWGIIFCYFTTRPSPFSWLSLSSTLFLFFSFLLGLFSGSLLFSFSLFSPSRATYFASPSWTTIFQDSLLLRYSWKMV